MVLRTHPNKDGGGGCGALGLHQKLEIMRLEGRGGKDIPSVTSWLIYFGTPLAEDEEEPQKHKEKNHIDYKGD
jgi:hypothetical protein